jgi:hypothetical protein
MRLQMQKYQTLRVVVIHTRGAIFFFKMDALKQWCLLSNTLFNGNNMNKLWNWCI